MENQSDQPAQNEPTIASAPVSVIQSAPAVPVAQEYKPDSLARKINRYTAITLIVSGTIFVLIAILAIWEVFGKDAGDVVWRALGSLGAIALGALIVSVASKLIDDKKQ